MNSDSDADINRTRGTPANRRDVKPDRRTGSKVTWPRSSNCQTQLGPILRDAAAAVA